MIIIHGENTIASRQKLVEIINQAKEQKITVVKLEAKKLTEATLEETLGSSDLFGNKKTIIIEGLHSLATSKKKKQLILMCSGEQLHQLVLWEKRALTKTMLKKFPKAMVFEYKISKALFNWLDSLGKPQEVNKKLLLLHQAIDKDGAHFCFIMLIRQLRMLIQVKTNYQLKGAPFVVAKLKKQASFFTLKKMLMLYKEILKLDYQLKTSKNLLTLNQWLDLLTIKL